MSLYAGFGLTLDLPFECPELYPVATGNADIAVGYGSVPAALERPTLSSPFFQRDARRLLLRVPGVASYLVADGNRIVIAPEDGADIERIRLFLLDTVMAALLQQRGVCPFHGFAIASGRGAILVVKIRGALGSSSLAAALIERGHRLLADGYAGVQIGAGTGAFALPGLRCQYLWADAVDALGLDIGGARAVPGLQQHRIDVSASHHAAPLPVSRIYVMQRGAATSIHPVQAEQRTGLVWQTLYQSLLCEWNPVPALRVLAAAVPMFDLRYGAGGWWAPAVAEAIGGHLEP